MQKEDLLCKVLFFSEHFALIFFSVKIDNFKIQNMVLKVLKNKFFIEKKTLRKYFLVFPKYWFFERILKNSIFWKQIRQAKFWSYGTLKRSIVFRGTFSIQKDLKTYTLLSLNFESTKVLWNEKTKDFLSCHSIKKYNSHYFTIRGGSLKKIAKKIIPNVPINKKV